MDRSVNPKKFFTPEEEKAIVAAIQEAERKTSGEIRVHLVKHCWGDVYEEAVKVFEKLGMTRTMERTGVLIYLALKNHRFAVVGDIGTHEKVPPDFWTKIRDAMQDDFQKGDFVKGLVDGIQTCGEQLTEFFPRRATDKNELSDQLSRK
jgi:uncharacterized membrane protein